MAGAEDDIKAMPMQLHTVMPHGGTTLSGGQRQRVMIARALVGRPKILFFDEATSALDNRTQREVQQSLDHLAATRVVIAHRLSTVRNADQIIVLKDGAIEETGTYEELMQNDGYFAELARRQLA
jgi:ATP-binding cassette subfamily C protein